MEKNQNDPALHNPSEALRGDSLNYKGVKQNISEEDENNEIHQKEKEIDPGNEHMHNEIDSASQATQHTVDASEEATKIIESKPE